MPTFTQAAFIRVDDTEQRKELCEWLECIGYRPSRALKMIEYVSYVFVNKGKVSVSANPTYLKRRLHAIDCGTNTKVFCALAALRDDSDCMQWFTDGQEWVLCASERKPVPFFEFIGRNSVHSYDYRKATPAEIVEHFKNKEA